jgi:carbon starvation protein
MGVCAWLGAVGRNNKMFYVPMVFMLIVTICSLLQTIRAKLSAGGTWGYIQAGLAIVLVVLALDLAVESFKTLAKQHAAKASAHSDDDTTVQA